MNVPRLSLDGLWEFIHLASDLFPPPVEVRQIQVPGVWQAQFDDLRTRGGMGLYRRTFELPDAWLAGAQCPFRRVRARVRHSREWGHGTPVREQTCRYITVGFGYTA